jgi:hypothetical protein
MCEESMENSYEGNPWVLALSAFALETGYDEDHPSPELMWYWLYSLEPIELFRLGDLLTDEDAEIGDAEDGYHIADFVLYARSLEIGLPESMSFEMEELEWWLDSFTLVVATFPMVRAGLMFPPKSRAPKPSVFEMPEDYGWIVSQELQPFMASFAGCDVQLGLLDEIDRREGR